MASEILQDLTAQHAGCRTVVFADLAQPMVLLSESRSPVHRERLQSLCLEGQSLLTAVDEGEIDPTTCCDTVLSANPDGLAVFLRLPDAPSDALCCLCDAHVDIASFLPAARACLEKLGATG